MPNHNNPPPAPFLFALQRLRCLADAADRRFSHVFLQCSKFWNVWRSQEFPNMIRLVETLEKLSKARKYVVDGERFLSRQKVYLDKLDSSGKDTSEAEEYLETLEEMQVMYVAHMERLEKQVLFMVKPAD
jgi:hypothetical protein